MILISKILTGDIGVTNKPETLIGKLIGLFYNYTHAFIFVWDSGELLVYEMIGRGKVVSKYYSKYALKNNWVLMRPIVPFRAIQELRIREFCIKYDYKYDKMSLLKHALYKWFGHWPGTFKKDKERICSEYIGNVINYASPYFFPEPETLTPESIRFYKFLKLVK